MDRVSGANYVTVAGKRMFQDENLSLGISGTELEQVWHNGVQEELAHVIEQAGLGLNASDNTQLYQSLLSFLAAKQAALGFTPVRQGAGPGQLSNVVSLGWDGVSLRNSVDGTDFGAIWTNKKVNDASNLAGGTLTLPNGDVTQIGQATVPLGATIIALPVAFASVCKSVLITEAQATGWSGGSPILYGYYPVNRAQIGVVATGWNGSSWSLTGGSATFNYLAKGY